MGALGGEGLHRRSMTKFGMLWKKVRSIVSTRNEDICQDRSKWNTVVSAYSCGCMYVTKVVVT